MIKKSKLLLASALCVLSVSKANASGYNLNEFSATNLGRSFAGIGIVGDDYSAIAFNPAGMTLKGTGVQGGVSVVEMNSDTRGYLQDNRTGDIITGPKGRLRLYKTLPHAFAQYNVNDKLALGGGIYTPFGLASVYNGDWFASYHGIKTELEVIDIAAGGAYKIHDKVSVGAMLINRYVRGNLINSLYQPIPDPKSRNQMDLDGWGIAYNFGIMYEHTEDTRFGVSYRLNSAHTVKGKHKIKRYSPIPMLIGDYDGRSKMTLPNQLILSGYHRLNSKIGLSATARWTKWDIFDDFVMESSKVGVVSIKEDWKNVWTFSVGMDYYYNPEWTFRIGYSKDPTPIKSPESRTARIPDADRDWITTGFSYKYKQMTLDVGYAHLFMKTAKIRNSDSGTTLYSKASGLSNMYSVQIQYEF